MNVIFNTSYCKKVKENLREIEIGYLLYLLLKKAEENRREKNQCFFCTSYCKKAKENRSKKHKGYLLYILLLFQSVLIENCFIF